MPTPSTEFLTDNFPQGIDWASGVDGTLGTPSVSGLGIFATAQAGGVEEVENIPIEESADSPIIERAEQATVTHTFNLPYDEAISRLNVYGRGALVQDSTGSYYRVLSASVQRQRGNMAKMVVTTESLSYDNPPDEFQITPTQLGVNILKHPRYIANLIPTSQILGYTGTQDTADERLFKQALVRAIQVYIENPYIPSAEALNGIAGATHEIVLASIVSGKLAVAVPVERFNPSETATEPVPVDGVIADETKYPNPPYAYIGKTDDTSKKALALAAAQEIIAKLWRQEDTPMLNGFEITWSEYYFRPQYLHPGGIIENPITANPPLPDYFISTDYPPTGINTIFDRIGNFNPQCYSATGYADGGVTISWLRCADTIEYQRTWFKVTKKWMGTPIGGWDGDLYNQFGRPTTVSDYHGIDTTTV